MYRKQRKINAKKNYVNKGGKLLCTKKETINRNKENNKVRREKKRRRRWMEWIVRLLRYL